MRKTNYNRRVWLNSKESSSTGSLVAFNETVTDNDNNELEWSFIEFADCRNKIKLHMSEDDTKEDFLNKLKIINKEVGEFINFLENK